MKSDGANTDYSSHISFALGESDVRGNPMNSATQTQYRDGPLHSAQIGSSLHPAQLEISTRMVILIRTHTKKCTRGDSIKKFFAGYVGWLTRTICTKFGDNWNNGTGNID